VTTQTLVNADATHIPVPDGWFHACITSPPYWGLRSYAGIEPTEWPAVTYTPMPGLAAVTVPGCAAGCRHEWGDERITTVMGTYGDKSPTFHGQSADFGGDRTVSQGSWCALCGGWRGCLGLEPTVEMYVAHLVLIFREVRRVLRDDATLWLNLGDSYFSDPKKGGSGTPTGRNNRGESYGREMRDTTEVVRYRLRSDLTPEQRAYVLAELARHS